MGTHHFLLTWGLGSGSVRKILPCLIIGEGQREREGGEGQERCFPWSYKHVPRALSTGLTRPLVNRGE